MCGTLAGTPPPELGSCSRGTCTQPREPSPPRSTPQRKHTTRTGKEIRARGWVCRDDDRDAMARSDANRSFPRSVATPAPPSASATLRTSFATVARVWFSCDANLPASSCSRAGKGLSGTVQRRNRLTHKAHTCCRASWLPGFVGPPSLITTREAACMRALSITEAASAYAASALRAAAALAGGTLAAVPRR